MESIILFIFYLSIIFSLIVGIFYHPLGILLMIADGIFHASAGQQILETSSPDHIIFRFLKANGLFNMVGFGPTIHRIMGIGLILSSLYIIYKVYIMRETNIVVDLYFRIIKPMTLVIISIAATVKLYHTVKNPTNLNGSVAMFRI